MKIVIRSLLFTGFILFSSFIQGQTEEETVNWLNQKFNECKGYNWVNLMVQENEKDGKFISVLNHYGSFAYAYNFPAEEVMAVKLSRAEAGNYNIIIRSNRILEITFEYDQNRNSKIKSKKDINEVVLVFDADLSDGTKIKKGFTHLINLLGGSLLTEDLFQD